MLPLPPPPSAVDACTATCVQAPEIIKGQSYSGAHVDVWSLGVALATMLTGTLPFQGAGDTELKKRILRGAFACPEHVSADARDLLQRMLALKPDERIDILAIAEHPWMRAYAEGRSTSLSREAARPAAIGADEQLDEHVLEKLGALGLDRAVVEAAVRANSYSHDAACYEMLLTAHVAEQSARLSVREAARPAANPLSASLGLF